MAAAVAKHNGLPIKHPSPKKRARAQDGDDSFLPLFGDNHDLDLGALAMRHRFREVALKEDDVIRPIFRDGSTAIDFG
jgi:hypothetical protein